MFKMRLSPDSNNNMRFYLNGLNDILIAHFKKKTLWCLTNIIDKNSHNSVGIVDRCLERKFAC